MPALSWAINHQDRYGTLSWAAQAPRLSSGQVPRLSSGQGGPSPSVPPKSRENSLVVRLNLW